MKKLHDDIRELNYYIDDNMKQLHDRIDDVIATSQAADSRITQSMHMAIFNMENEADERFDTVFDSLGHVQAHLRVKDKQSISYNKVWLKGDPS